MLTTPSVTPAVADDIAGIAGYLAEAVHAGTISPADAEIAMQEWLAPEPVDVTELRDNRDHTGPVRASA